jgi:hypothetical protein
MWRLVVSSRKWSLRHHITDRLSGLRYEGEHGEAIGVGTPENRVLF